MFGISRDDDKVVDVSSTIGGMSLWKGDGCRVFYHTLQDSDLSPKRDSSSDRSLCVPDHSLLFSTE